MLVDFLLYSLTFVANLFIAVLPAGTLWPLPVGITDAMAFIGTQIAVAGAVLPTGTLLNLTGALTLVAAANLLVLPWLAARNFRLPFAASTKRE